MNISLLLDIPAAMHPNRLAVTEGDQRLTFEELAERVARLSAWLRSKSPSGPVAYLGGSRAAFVEWLFAAASAGIPFAPLNYRAKIEELAYFLDTVQPGLIAAEPRYHELVASAAAGAEVFDPRVDLPLAQQVLEPVFDAASPAVILFTSGTTARPKVATLTQGNLTSYVLSTVEAGSSEADEAVLLSVPPYHIAGVTNVLSNIHRARRLVLLPQFDGRAWLEAVKDQRITHAFVVPTMLVRILDALTSDPSLTPESLLSLSYGGSRAPAGLIERAMTLLPASVGFINAFGLTETSSTVAVLTPEDHRAAFAAGDPAERRRLDSAGRPLEGIEILVVDDAGDPLPPGERGEVWLRGAQIVAAGTDASGWLHTGDLGSVDRSGYLFIHGRLDDVIIRGGENIVPQEIEDVLEAHPSVSEAVVVGLPDPEWGEVVAALLVGDPVDDEDLVQWVRRHLAGYKVPAVFQWCEELPRNDMGKLVRRRAIDQLTRDLK